MPIRRSAPSEFEEEVRRSHDAQKLQAALTDWMTVTDADVEAEFKRRNEKVKLAVVSFPADKFLVRDARPPTPRSPSSSSSTRTTTASPRSAR